MNMRTGLKWCVVGALLTLVTQPSFAQNPILGGDGISDPHIRVFGDQIYLFSGHDASPKDKTWVMKDWRIFATTDLVNWKQVGTISPKDNYMDDDSTDCWAGDAASRNGRYYFYFSDGKRGVGVMDAPAPEGPYKDALGKPLVAPLHDPTVFIDDDPKATPYMVYGDKSASYYRIARLNDDMISLAEEPKSLIITGKEWKDAPSWMDKNYLFKYRDTYYLSWGRDYAISKNIYGPYECVGPVGEGYGLGDKAHGSFFWWKGQFYHDWCYYLKKGTKYRATVMTYCHFDDEGRIVTDTGFLDQHFACGVGQYDASWDKIEAEWYYAIPDGPEKTTIKDGGFQVSNLRNGDYLRFPNIHNCPKDPVIALIYSSADAKGGAVSVRLGDEKGRELGRAIFAPTGSWTDYKRGAIPLKGVPAGTVSLAFIFEGAAGQDLIHLDAFSVQSSK